MAQNYTNLGNLKGESGQAVEAMEFFQKALRILDQLAREHPNVTVFRQDLGKTVGNLAVLQTLLGRLAEAKQSYRRAAEILDAWPMSTPTSSSSSRTSPRPATIWAACSQPPTRPRRRCCRTGKPSGSWNDLSLTIPKSSPLSRSSPADTSA